jgi:hypothetical protein
MMAMVGSMPNVKGNNKAIAMEGEIPGNAPPKMPHKTPRNAVGTAQLPKMACTKVSNMGWGTL